MTKQIAYFCGWVDIDESNYEAFMYLVVNKGDYEHNPNQIKELYQK